MRRLVATCVASLNHVSEFALRVKRDIQRKAVLRRVLGVEEEKGDVEDDEEEEEEDSNEEEDHGEHLEIKLKNVGYTAAFGGYMRTIPPYNVVVGPAIFDNERSIAFRKAAAFVNRHPEVFGDKIEFVTRANALVPIRMFERALAVKETKEKINLSGTNHNSLVLALCIAFADFQPHKGLFVAPNVLGVSGALESERLIGGIKIPVAKNAKAFDHMFAEMRGIFDEKLVVSVEGHDPSEWASIFFRALFTKRTAKLVMTNMAVGNPFGTTGMMLGTGGSGGSISVPTARTQWKKKSDDPMATPSKDEFNGKVKGLFEVWTTAAVKQIVATVMINLQQIVRIGGKASLVIKVAIENKELAFLATFDSKRELFVFALRDLECMTMVLHKLNQRKSFREAISNLWLAFRRTLNTVSGRKMFLQLIEGGSGGPTVVSLNIDVPTIFGGLTLRELDVGTRKKALIEFLTELANLKDQNLRGIGISSRDDSRFAIFVKDLGYNRLVCKNVSQIQHAVNSFYAVVRWLKTAAILVPAEIADFRSLIMFIRK